MVYETGSPAENKQGQWKGRYKLQPLKAILHDPPVLNTENDFLEIIDTDAQVIHMGILQLNDEAAAKDIQIKATIDGVDYDTTVGIAHNTINVILLTFVPISYDTDFIITATPSVTGKEKFVGDLDAAFVSNFKITLTLKTAAGTNQKLYYFAVWGKRDA